MKVGGANLLFGALAIGWAAALVALSLRRRQHVPWATCLLWSLFGAGLLLQSLAPPLTVRNNAFVFPREMLTPEASIEPARLVSQTRLVWLTSGLLTLGAAIGLALRYRPLLLQRSSDRDSLEAR